MVICTWLALLPAVALTAYLGREGSIPFYLGGIPLRGVVPVQICLLMTGLLNTTIAMYYSLKEKQSGKAALKTVQWFTIPTLGTAAFTGICFTLLYLFHVITGIANTPLATTQNNGFAAFFALPNLINPILVGILTSIPSSSFEPTVTEIINTRPIGKNETFLAWCIYIAWLTVPFLYPAGCVLVIRNLCKRMIGKFHDAPKDASG
jgi:hypothetical protein